MNFYYLQTNQKKMEKRAIIPIIRWKNLFISRIPLGDGTVSIWKKMFLKALGLESKSLRGLDMGKVLYGKKGEILP